MNYEQEKIFWSSDAMSRIDSGTHIKFLISIVSAAAFYLLLIQTIQTKLWNKKKSKVNLNIYIIYVNFFKN